MTEKVKYIAKGHPTRVKRISNVIGMIALLLFVVGDFLYTPLKSLPLELQVFAIGEMIPRIFLEFNVIVVLLFSASFALYTLRWRRGTVSLAEQQLIIEGSISFSILMEKIREISFFHSDFMAGNKRLMQIKTSTGVFKIKFISDESFAQFAERVVLTASHYDIKIDSSVLHKPE